MITFQQYLRGIRASDLRGLEFRGLDLRGRGLTLVELLVVITVIVLLIALLLPALGKAKQAVQATLCLSNQRQLAVAADGYHSDHAVYPQPIEDTDITPITVRAAAVWFNALDYYLSLSRLNYDGSTATRHNMEFKQDPIWKAQVPEASHATNRTIKMNHNFGDMDNVTAARVRWSRPSDFRRAHETVLFVDGRAYDVRPTDTITASHFHAREATVGLRHNGHKAANVAFLDGHASLVEQAIRPDTAAPSWYADPLPQQELRWRQH